MDTQPLFFIPCFRWAFVWRRGWNLRLRLHRCRQGELWQLLREVPSPVEERGSHCYRQRKASTRDNLTPASRPSWPALTSGLAGAVGWKRVEPLPRRPWRCGHRQAQQKAAPGHSGHPEHADRGRRTHAGHEAVEQAGREDWGGSVGAGATSGTFSSRDYSSPLHSNGGTALITLMQ